jgi:large subunit ribosomal protein L6
MSKIGKTPIRLPEGIRLQVDGRIVKVAGPKGELERLFPRELEVKKSSGFINLIAKKKNRRVKTLHGTYRSLLSNMVTGVSEGFIKELELVGAGYSASLDGKDLVLNVGYSHPVKIRTPEGIHFKVEKLLVTVEGVDKELVGKVAAEIRAVRPPEPYKGKGIKYKDEVVRRKPGKAAKAQGEGV